MKLIITTHRLYIQSLVSRLLQIGCKLIKVQWRHNFWLWPHRQIFWRCFISLLNFSYWSKFHGNIITGSSIMTISLYRRLTRKPKERNTPIWVFPNIWRLGRVKNTKFSKYFSNKSYCGKTNRGLSYLSPRLGLRIQKIQVVSILCLQLSNLVLWEQQFLKLVSLVIIKLSQLSWNYILLGKFLKENITETTVNLMLITFSSKHSRRLNSDFCSIKEIVVHEELNNFIRFHRVFLNLLNIQTPLISPFITKTLRKAIVIRSRLKDRFRKTRYDKNWSLYKTQSSLCTKL